MKSLRTKHVTVQAKTKERAIEEALQQLNTSVDQANVKILQEPRKGILGFFQRDAKVYVECNRPPNEKAKLFLNGCIEKMGIHPEIEFLPGPVAQSIYIQIKGDNLGILIGKKGRTIDSLQYLVNLVANQDTHQPIRFLLDVNGYRKKREELLVQLAKRVAKKVKKERKSVKLEPMPAFERKIIHTFFENDPELITESEGTEPNRSVRVRLKTPE